MRKTEQSASLIKNAFYKGLLNIFNLIIPIFTIPYLYRVLSPTSMGDFEYANTLFTYFNLWGVLGIYTYGIREISRIRDHKKQVNQTYTSLFSIGIFSNLIVWCIFIALACFAFHDTSLFRLLLIFSLNLISNIFYTEWINEAFEDFRFITIKTGIIRLLYVAGIFIFIQSPDDLWIYVALIVISNFLNYTCSFVYSRRYTHFSLLTFHLSKNDFKKYLPPLFFILVLDNSAMFYTALDRIMLGSLGESQMVAYYSVGQRIMDIVRSLLITITYVSLPRLSYYLGNNESLYKLGLQRLLRIGLLLAIPMAVGLGLLSKDIVLIFSGKQYLPAVLPLIIFSIRIITLLIENITASQVLFLHKKEKLVASINILWGIGNLCANYSLFQLGIFTPETAILSTLCTELGLLITEVCYIKHKLQISINLFTKSTFKYIVFALLFIPIIYAIKAIGLNVFFTLSLAIFSCMTLYAICLYLSKDELFLIVYIKLKQMVKNKVTH